MKNSFVSSFVNEGRKLSCLPCNPFLFCFSTIGLFNYVCLTSYLWWRWDDIAASALEVFFLYIAITWVPLGTWAIWYYENVLLARFADQVDNIVKFEKACDCKTGIPPRAREIIALIWGISVTVVYLKVDLYCFHRLALESGFNTFYILSVLSVLIQAILTGVGFSLSLNTISLMSKLYNSCSMVIKPYDCDGKGGLSVIKDLCFLTPVLFSTGVLYLPILLTVANFLGHARGVIALTVVFSLFLTCSYLVPYVFVYEKIKEKLISELAVVGSRLETLYSKITDGDANSEIYSSINVNRNLYLDIKSIDCHPINTKSILFMFSQLLQPLVFVFVKVYIESHFKK